MSASNWRRLIAASAADVTVIEAGPQLMGREDPDVARGDTADPR